MIDPITAITAATAAFNTVKKLVNAGQEVEAVFGQMGKWYTAVADLRKAKELSKNPPLFKKLFYAGSVEEEALQLLIHEKKIMEQESELRTILEWRFGMGTWNELIQLRRKIKAERDRTIYRQIERRRALFEGIAVIALIGILLAILGGGVYLVLLYS